jgi:muramoyltetrapeptide carboxypeptidase
MILIDPPNAAGHGRMWSHLASDASYDELHAFARVIGVPERGFDRDHYDVPAHWYDRVVEAGATPVTSRELIVRIRAAGLRRRKSESLRPRRPGRGLLRPPLLRPGDVVQAVAPAGPADVDKVAAGMSALGEWGLEVRPPEPGAAAEFGWLAASDQDRAAALERAWLDPEVSAVWCTRGGFGSQRVLDLLDWQALAAGVPKVLVGFSDITALHQGFASRLGVSTVHGPVLTSIADRDEATRAALRALLFDGAVAPVIGTMLAPGSAEGTLVGGNLTVLAAAAGGALVHPATDSIALLEDVGELPYRLDRSLTQLLRSGWFDGVRGIVLGQFTDCGAGVQALLEARLRPLGVPILADVGIGHGPSNLAIPLGVRAQLTESRLTVAAVG